MVRLCSIATNTSAGFFSPRSRRSRLAAPPTWPTSVLKDGLVLLRRQYCRRRGVHLGHKKNDDRRQQCERHRDLQDALLLPSQYQQNFKKIGAAAEPTHWYRQACWSWFASAGSGLNHSESNTSADVRLSPKTKLRCSESRPLRAQHFNCGCCQPEIKQDRRPVLQSTHERTFVGLLGHDHRVTGHQDHAVKAA